MNNDPGRESRQFWSVTEYGVECVTGYACANPELWWCPEVGYTLTKEVSLFNTQKEALSAAIIMTRKEYVTAFNKLQDLELRLSTLE